MSMVRSVIPGRGKSSQSLGRPWRRRAAVFAAVAGFAASAVVPIMLVAQPAHAAQNTAAAVARPAGAQAVVPGAAVLPQAAPAPAPAGNEINGVVWLDLDGDGINDTTETGFTGAVVALRDKDGTLVGTRTTTSSGLYSFAGLPPGQGPYCTRAGLRSLRRHGQRRDRDGRPPSGVHCRSPPRHVLRRRDQAKARAEPGLLRPGDHRRHRPVQHSRRMCQLDGDGPTW